MVSVSAEYANLAHKDSALTKKKWRIQNAKKADVEKSKRFYTG